MGFPKGTVKVDPRGDVLRLAYNRVVEMYQEAPVPVFALPSTLRSEAVLTTNNSISWNFMQNAPNTSGGVNAVRSSERRLNTNDAFMVTGLSIMFGNELSAGTTPGSVLLQTWENPAAVAVLPATIGGFGANAAALIECYNGTLDMVVQSVQVLKNYDMLHFKRVDTAQAGTLLFTASNQAQSFFHRPEVFGAMTPFINIGGGMSVELTLNLPDATAFTGVPSNRVIAVAELEGILIQNGATPN